MKLSKMLVCLTSGLAAAISSLAVAQWSGDPSVNLAIADRTGEQVQPKIVATSTGGAYVSWFDNNSGGYDVYLQRLDADGNEQWAHNGILIADRTFSSTQDYDLEVDASDNALLAFRDTRLGGTQITATKVNPAGTQVWGGTGVQLTSTSDFVAAPKIAATSDGFIIVAWTQGDFTHLMKLDTNGTPVWGADVVLATAGSTFSASDLDASQSGAVIIALVRGFFGATLHAQKIAANGSLLWGPEGVAVFDGGALQMGNFPSFVADDDNGAVFGWYESSPLQCRVQRLNGAGVEAFAHNGVVASTNGSRIRVSPSVDYSSATQEIYLFWIEENGSQSQWGVYGQKFNATGVRQWTDDGLLIRPVNTTYRTQVNCLATSNGAEVYWVETTTNDRVFGAQVDKDGLFTWTPTIIMPCSLSTGKSRLTSARSTQGFAMLGWQDTRTDASDVYMQNVNPDGSFGPPVPGCPEDLVAPAGVEQQDLNAVLNRWGDADCLPGGAAHPCPEDLASPDGVEQQDLNAVLNRWGDPDCEPGNGRGRTKGGGVGSGADGLK